MTLQPLPRPEPRADDAADYLELVSGDSSRYARWSTHDQRIDDLKHARAYMMFYAHALEKGLSRSNGRPFFGRRALPGLAAATTWWLDHGGSQTDTFFLASVAVVSGYVRRHQEMGLDPWPKLPEFHPALVSLVRQGEALEPAVDTVGLGVATGSPGRSWERGSDQRSDPRSWWDVVEGRRSIREFGHPAVPEELLERAVAMSQRSPSVCNRQGARVHLYLDRSQIERALDLQAGFHGYAPPPVLALVTCDLTVFVHRLERRQPYIDGGLFAMTFLHALQYLGLAACPLNAMLGRRDEDAMRGLLDLPEDECLIMFVGIGTMPERVQVPHSARQATADVLTIHR